MGLTIHYRFSLPKQADPLPLITALRERALDLPFEEVGPILNLYGDECDFTKSPEGDPDHWLKIQSTHGVEYEAGGYHYRMSVAPHRLIAFSIYPADGSEQFNVGFAYYPAFVEPSRNYGPRRRIRISPTWKWDSFCKTHYASLPESGGIPNFLRCHLSVVRLLDYAKELGVLRRVSDEGEFWKSRNVKTLAGEITDQSEQLAALAGVLQGLGYGVEAPITSHSNFERLEMAGRMSNPRIDALAKALKATP